MRNLWIDSQPRKAGWADVRATKDENRRLQFETDLRQLGLTPEQHATATSHPIFYQVLQIALSPQGRADKMSFWEAQYAWLGISEETISPTGTVRIEFEQTTFQQEIELFRMMSQPMQLPIDWSEESRNEP